MKNIKIGKKYFDFKKKTYIMGILNITPDSFYNGNKFFSIDKAVDHAISMEEEGANIIDVGGQSTRPGANPISFKEEINRVLPVVKILLEKLNIPISVDTNKSKIAEKVLDLGVPMINDISGLRNDKKMIDIIKDYKCTICIMHMKGNPSNMQNSPTYKNTVKEIHKFLKERIKFAVKNGIKKEKIIIDPGIGFGKRTGKGIEDNCEILRHLHVLKNLNSPILIGASRKKFIGNVCKKTVQLPEKERLEGSLAAAVIAAINGANIIRVHDVEETRRCLQLVNCVYCKTKLK
jgi:dihydropteroate synthase